MNKDTASQSQAVPSELASLKQLAMAATPGPWHWVNPSTDQQRQPGEWRASLRTVDEFPAKFSPGTLPLFIVEADEICDENMDANAAFIAAANPATVLKLIEQVESLSHSAATGKVPPSQWDEWAMARSRKMVQEMEDISHPRFQLIARIHCMLIDAMEFASPAAPLAGKAEEDQKAAFTEYVHWCAANKRVPMAYSSFAPLAGKAEPVAWMTAVDNGFTFADEVPEQNPDANGWHWTPLYTAPLAAAVPAEEASDDVALELCARWKARALKAEAALLAPAEPAPIQSSAEKLTETEIKEMAVAACLTPARMSTVIDFAQSIERTVLARLSTPTAQGAASEEALKEMEARKDAAYYERNQVVAALAKCFPSGVATTAIEGWSEDWHGCVYIDLPTGQVSWHFHDSQAHLFAGLPAYGGKWDGHDTPEKYRRVAALQSPAQVTGEPASIDTPEFRELLMKCGYQKGGTLAERKLAVLNVIQFIDRHIAAQASAGRDAQQWISVDERLPECSSKDGSLGVEVIIWPRIEGGREQTAFFGRRVTADPWFYKYGETLHVTHWLPLPAAPHAAEQASGGAK